MRRLIVAVLTTVLALLALAAPVTPAAAAGPAQDAADAVTLVHPDDVRGNLTLPTSGLGGATLTWASSDPGVVTPTGEVTRPAHGEDAAEVVLTVTAAVGGETAERDVPLVVRALPEAADYEGYAFAYFAGESTADGEKIYLGASRGDDPLAYDELNDGEPVLESSFGERGLRDPFVIRSPEGDRFFLLATDLRIFGGGDFGTAQETGSRYLEIWESTDLVNWSAQRHVKVSSDFAGNTWAPEAFYDEEAGEYVVYWASALYPTADGTPRDIGTSYQRMMYATTRDFVTFSEPQPWVDVPRGSGRGMIDATVQRVGDTFYRVIKDEASFTVRQERSPDLRATVTGSLPTTTSPADGWQLVKERVGAGQPNPWGGTFNQGEGPTMFQDNDDPDRWYLFIDQPSYHGGRGYLAFTTDDLPNADWHVVTDARLPSSPRHGTVLPVTQAELDAMRAAFQPDLLVESAGDVSVTTRQGTAPDLPATVPAGFGDDTTGPVEVTWDAVDPADYAAPGTFTVTGTVDRGSADRPVATVRVTDAVDPSVSVTAPRGWVRARTTTVRAAARDASGVQAVEISVDGRRAVRTPGRTATARVAGDGLHRVVARADDVTGNRSAPVAATVRIDATRPVSRATRDGRRVVLRAADATSGVARVQYRLRPGAPWRVYRGPLRLSRGATVHYRAVDVAGNVEPTRTLVVP